MKKRIFLALLSLSVSADVEETEALKAMRLACEKHKVALGCFNYANMLIRANKIDDADKYFELGCKLEHSPSCSKDKWDIPESTVSEPIVDPMVPEQALVPDTEM